MRDENATRAKRQAMTFEEIVDAHSRLVYRVSYSVLRNPSDAEDAVQETFLKVFKARAQDVQDYAGWVARIAYRTALDRLEKRKTIDVNEIELADSRESPHDALSREQEVRKLRKMIAGLPEELRAPLVLSAIEELNSRQIGEVLGVNEVTVRTRIMRAKQLLKEKLEAGMKR